MTEFAAAADDFDAAVVATDGIDKFCSSSAWVLSASEALMPPRLPFLHRGDGGWWAAMRGLHGTGLAYAEPLELAWGLASPLVGGDPARVADEAVEVLASARGLHVAIIAGLAADAPILRAFLAAAPRGWDRRWGQPTIRHVASLAGGVDGFLARRSRNFRKALRAAQRDAAAAGVTFEAVQVATPAEALALYARILAVEVTSWKAAEGVGINAGAMRDFYERMIVRLAAHGRQRTIFARQGDRDVAYVLGAVFADEYRGLQFSYDASLEKLSLGSLCQLHQIEALCAEGIARYDLGTDMDYKRRWAEEQFETGLLVVAPRV
ncbi:MAG: GNAT family N-acetyltransferase [Deltaproteobacteria bacterium]|nr:GNAT family N-acetyltransferase [Deltaproteobacteria bacterium]